MTARTLAEAWDEAIEALAWCLNNGPRDVDAAITYVAEHNPYHEGVTP